MTAPDEPAAPPAPPAASPPPTRCVTCGKTFGRPSALYRHQREVCSGPGAPPKREPATRAELAEVRAELAEARAEIATLRSLLTSLCKHVGAPAAGPAAAGG